MKVKLPPVDSKSDTTLGDWYAQDIVCEKKQFIFCMSERGRLPLIMDAAPYAKFPDRFRDQLLHLFLAIGVEENKAQAEWKRLETLTLGKTDNRSVVGTMKQFILNLQFANPRNGLNRESPLELSLLLSENVTLTLPELHPKDAVLALFGQPAKKASSTRQKLYIVQ